jgi:predicted TIM-barrel fold metal-dependent hydrolase
MLEWPYDTGRAVVSLLLGGALAKYPDIKWIFSHAGGPVPALAGRIVNMTRNRPDLAQIAPQGVMHELTRLHYDTANASFAPTMAALLKFVPVSQVLFGSDYPYYSLEENVGLLAEVPLSDAERQAIDRGNAARLMPRFSG